MKFWTRSWQWGADGCRSCLSTLAWAKVWPAKPNHKRLKRQSIVWMLDLFQTHNSVQTRQYVPVFWGSSLLNLRCPTRAPLLVLCTSPRWSHNSPHWSLRCSFGTWISRCPSCSKTSSQVVFWLGSVATMRWKQSSHCQLQELKWWAKEKTLPHSPCQAFRPMLDEHHLEMCRLKAGHCSSDSPTLRNSSNHGWPHRSCVHHRWRSTHTWGEEQFQKASDLQHSWKATIDMSATQKQYFKIDISKWFLIGIKSHPIWNLTITLSDRQMKMSEVLTSHVDSDDENLELWPKSRPMSYPNALESACCHGKTFTDLWICVVICGAPLNDPTNMLFYRGSFLGWLICNIPPQQPSNPSMGPWKLIG